MNLSPKYPPYTICAFITIGCLCIALSAFTTKYSSLNTAAIRLYEEAMHSYLQKRYTHAIDLLEKACEEDKTFIEVYLQLATIYSDREEFDVAEQFLNHGRAYVAVAKTPYLLYKLAQLYYTIGAYTQASDVLKTISFAHITSPSLQENVHTLQHNLQFALEMIQSPVPFHPKPLAYPLNQFIAQYFPIITVDQKNILFTALTAKGDNNYVEDIYMSEKDALGNWSMPQSISPQINRPSSNEGTCTISADQKTLIFTACAKEGNYGMCDLYISYKQHGEWSKPENLGSHINSKGWQSQPSLSADGKTLYFVSERQGNYGKHDIWQSTLQDDGQWSPAMNLGPTINSRYREEAPFIHPNGQTLFFVSNRTPSMGGFDIYYAHYIDGQWTTPVHLSYPINNHKDQVSIFITPDGKKGYYADGKKKAFHYHSYIYEFEIPENLIEMPKCAIIQLEILDAETKQATDARVDVYDMHNALQHSLYLDASDRLATLVINEGKEYLVYITKDGYLFESKHIQFQNSDQPIVTPSGEVWLQAIAVSHRKILENIYFAYDDYKIMPQSYTELQRLVAFLEQHPHINIQLEGHTDHIGSKQYNKTLSIKRAETIYDYLIQAGIASSRLTYKGYGKTKPLIKSDSPESQELNRRVAFRITKI